MSLNLSNLGTDTELLCPLCGGEWTHVDDIFMAGRPREDGPIVPVHVDSSGSVRNVTEALSPVGNQGRRHSIALVGSCETCAGRFAVEFRQHKGQTLVSVMRQSWSSI